MMSLAEGVCRVDAGHSGVVVEGDVWTRALIHITIGIDDTDTKYGGATFALALALLSHVSSGMRGVLPIAHHVAMLNQGVFSKTAGNSASFIEVAVEPKKLTELVERTKKFVAGESLSPEWGIAVKQGFTIPPGLRDYGRLVRGQIISRPVAEATAEQYGVILHGGNGVIGALGAVALGRLPHEILLDPGKDIDTGLRINNT
jgi:tRNA(Ile2) C34 agmatinyltransferase TiaS